MPQPAQNLSNHARFVPLFHFVCFGLLTANLVHAGLALKARPSGDTLNQLLLGVGLILLAWFTRAFALAAQDRVIRLEMALRVQRIAPELAGRFAQLTPGQFIALRFASDSELPGLMREVLDGKLKSAAEIKKRVTEWQGDYLRV